VETGNRRLLAMVGRGRFLMLHRGGRDRTVAHPFPNAQPIPSGANHLPTHRHIITDSVNCLPRMVRPVENTEVKGKIL
jgi:hypothetical protein